MPLSIAEIAEMTSGTMSDVADPALRITGPVVADSRAVVPGVPGARSRSTASTVIMLIADTPPGSRASV